MRRFLAAFAVIFFLFSSLGSAVFAAETLSVPAKSCILTALNGTVLYEENADTPMPPASITKIMTLLLTFEAIDEGRLSLDQTVSCSEHAASMGGSQIWLEPGEEMTLSDIIKGAAVNSANDCAMVLAETVGGSEEGFVEMMNRKAQELHMTGTHFENPTGLDADGHLSTARDIAIMSAELLRHKKAAEYTSIWMDSLRNGKTALVNTNKLVRFYDGCIGLKTGTTDGAGSCLSAAAVRDRMTLIAVSMRSPTSKERFAACRTLLDYGFSSYELFSPVLSEEDLAPVPVKGGESENVLLSFKVPDGVPIPKGRADDVKKEISRPEALSAPVSKDAEVGTAEFSLDGETLIRIPLQTAEEIPEVSFPFFLKTLWETIFPGMSR